MADDKSKDNKSKPVKVWTSSRNRTRSLVNYAANLLAFKRKNISRGDISPKVE